MSRSEYLILEERREGGAGRVVYVGTRAEMVSAGRGWAAQKGLTLTAEEWTTHMVQQCHFELIAKSRAEWPVEARDLCERYEKELFSEMVRVDAAKKERDKADDQTKDLESRLVELRRITTAAESAAEAMRQRVRESDPARIRREVEAEAAAQMAKVAEENKALKERLHEAESQVAKLSEDKRRLRAALNSSRGR
jgi:hypothetical protein